MDDNPRSRLHKRKLGFEKPKAFTQAIEAIGLVRDRGFGELGLNKLSAIACVMFEPVRFEPPKERFLHEVRELCVRNGVVLALDEMITGLKMGVPGASEYFGVKGDITTWGKGIANGAGGVAAENRDGRNFRAVSQTATRSRCRGP